MTLVLDASALLALLLEEPGSEIVSIGLSESVIGAVNLAEVVERLSRNFPADAVTESLSTAGLSTIAADRDLAMAAGRMSNVTRSSGLSLGDRFCLALARHLECPALTADRNWLAIADAVGVDVRLIR